MKFITKILIEMPKKNKGYFISVFFIVFLTIIGVNVRAHPPDDMILSYNPNTNILIVTIIHGVSDNTTHYISSVEVKINGTTEIHQIYASQPDRISFTYEYSITTNSGSTITVKAICIVGGSITRTLGGASGPNGGAIPGYMGLYLVLVVSLITLLIIICKKLKRI